MFDMARAWRATTTIKAGQAGVFKPGDIVTGLTKGNMAQLWESGALEETTVEEAPSEGNQGPTEESQGGDSKGAGDA